MDATQTPATPADSILSIEAVIAFFEAHGIESFPIAPDTDSLEAFKAEQNEHWAATLDSYQKLKAAWSKARSELDRALGAKAPKEELIEELAAVEAEHHAAFSGALPGLLEARAFEAITRQLPWAFEDAAAARFVAKELKQALIYAN